MIPNGNIVGAAKASGGSGTVTTTGSPTNGNLAEFSGSSSITNGNLSGDITTSGSLATTLATVNSNVGSYTNASITVNAKGLVTAASSGGSGVSSLNTLTGAVTLAAGTNITLTPSGNTITVAASGGGGSPGGSSGDIQYNNSGSFGGSAATVDSAGNIGALTFNSSAAQSTVSGSTSGSVVFSQPCQGVSFKKVIAYCNTLSGSAAFTYPTAFTHAPVATYPQGGAVGVTISANTTSVTLTASPGTYAGYVILEGY